MQHLVDITQGKLSVRPLSESPLDVPEFEVILDDGSDNPWIIFTAHAHPADGNPEHNAVVASLIPEMFTLIATLANATPDGLMLKVVQNDAIDLIARVKESLGG